MQEKTMEYGGKEYAITKKTMKIARMIEAAETATTVTEAYRREFDFVRAVIGDEACKEIFESTNVEEIDLDEMVCVYNTIITAYEKEITEQRKAQEAEALNTPAFTAIREIARDVDKITALDSYGKKKK